MSHALRMIAQLDRQTENKGETVSYMPPGWEMAAGTIRCVVRDYKPGELQGGLKQGDSNVIVSPSQLDGPIPALEQGGRLVVSDVPRFIETVTPVKLNDIVVRYDLWVRG